MIRKNSVIFLVLLLMTVPALAQDDPGAAFKAYASAVKKARTLGDLRPYLTQSHYQGDPKMQELKLMSAKNVYDKSSIKVLQQRTKGDKALVQVERSITVGGKTVPAETTLELMRQEEGRWKYDVPLTRVSSDFETVWKNVEASK